MAMSGRITTHVLDLSCGRPAVGIRVELWRHGAHRTWELLQTMITNSDGRLNQPLLEGGAITIGSYELIFYVQEFYEAVGRHASSIYNEVPIRFAIERAEEHYHVPLLISPGGYSTYRGS